MYKALVSIALYLMVFNANASLISPPDLGFGDKYHVIFVSSTSINGVAGNISTYDAHVQSAANAAGIGVSINVGWQAVASALNAPAAKDRLQSLFSDLNSVPIYNQNSIRVANSFNDLWDGSLLASVGYDENGNFQSSKVWTGTNEDGNFSTQPLGTLLPGTGRSNSASGA